MLAANEIKVDTNELVQILTLTKKDILGLESPFECEKSCAPVFTYPFFGEDQLTNLAIPAGTQTSVLDALEIVLCVETSLSRDSASEFCCYLGVSDEVILGEARGMIESKLQEMTMDPIKFYHSWSEYQEHIKGHDDINDVSGGDLVDLTNRSDLVHVYGRIQLLLPFFIEAATPINLKDSKWSIYLSLKNGDNDEREITGLLTAYRYFRFPEGSRVRISQVLIFPRFQGKRLGQRLYGNVTRLLRDMEDCVEICVEDPTDKFERIRSAVDWRDARDKGLWDNEIATSAESDTTCANTCSSTCDIATLLINKLKAQLKLTEEQAERIYNLNCSLKLSGTNTAKKVKLEKDPAITAHRQQVKRWLLKKYRKDLPEGREERIGKLAELYEVEREEFLNPLMNELRE